ncbi:MAG TPA: efflux RND transporter periplasmic adaptor subunit [Candidatus Melainabacteria bacterium]|nr:efflux RND transporter periplasmic adaptor subunit [Candidatus Melainabacteria bacterium]HIN63309.1 efflux RND transporter periplasmic adaptor subunit [Candidatus Obscuribacterales bacterium]
MRPQLFFVFLFLSLILAGCAVTSSNKAELTQDEKSEQSQSPEIKCEIVDVRPMSPTVHCTGQIKPLFGKEYLVSTRLAGRVLKISASPGDYVHAGQNLAYVDSQQISEIQAEAIRASSHLAIAKAHEERELRVYQEDLARPKALIAAKTAHQQAVVSQAAAQRNYTRLKSLYKEGIAAEKDYMNAKSALEKANLDLAQAKLEEQREQQLFDNKALIKKNWQLAHAETQSRANELQTIKERLHFLGVDSDIVGDSIVEKHLQPLMPILSPANGTVVQQFVSQGSMVGPDEPIFSICDMKVVAISCELPESELSLVRKGLPVTVAVTTYADSTFTGKVTYVGSRLDPKTRTVSVRAVIDNAKGLLKLNMFATVDIVGQARTVLSCPRDAIHESGGKTVVYVRDASGEFSKRAVSTGISSGNSVEIKRGLRSGEAVVTVGGVLVKTKLLMSSRSDK